MENVIKQGYLRKGFPSDRGLSGLLDKIDPNKWFVFLVRGGTPFLEYYDKQNDVFSSEPVNSFDLSTCKQVTFTFLRNARIHTFNIILEDRVIELASTSRDLMISWCDCIENTLQRLGIYRKVDHDHVYSFCPAVVNKGGPKPDEEPDTKADSEEEGATADYSIPDTYIFGTFGEMEDKREKLKTDEEEEEKKKEKKMLRKISSVSEDDSDYSGDFVGEDFFRKHRINVGEKKSDSLGKSVVKSERHSVLGLVSVPKTEDSNNNNFNLGGCIIDDLDDGYSELMCVKKGTRLVNNEQPGIPYMSSAISSSLKETSSPHIKHQGSFPEDLSKEKLTVNLPQTDCGSADTCVKTTSSCASASASSCHAEASAQQSSSSNSDKQRTENLYSDFPCPQEISSNTSPTFSETSPKSLDPLAARPSIASPDIKPIPKKRTSIHKSGKIKMTSGKPFPTWETFETEVPAERFPPPMKAPPRGLEEPQRDTSNGIAAIPPLPPRFDSLPTWGSASMDETALKQPKPNSSSIMSQSAIENSVVLPPRPPRLDSNHVQRSSSTSDVPPPLPARKSQSFRIQRPLTSPPNMSDSHNGEERLNGREERPRRPDRQLSMRMRVERGHSAHTVISLKHNQVDILLGEILSAAVICEISQKSGVGLALVDIQHKVWIAGWNWKDYPGLHSKFHVGDEVVSINTKPVENAQSAMKMLKHGANAGGTCEIVVRRIPNAKVFEIRREAEGQSLGIKREGGTGEIIYVDPNGLAASNGLQARAECVLMPGLVCNWYFTEINSRPVGLFFKGLEIEHRLNAVGLELSFVVQPSDFILEIKKQLQKKIKNYKNYLPQ